MSKTKKMNTAKILFTTAAGLIASERVQKSLFGVYSDGSARSLSDCLDGEILSPKDRERMLYKKRKKLKSSNGKKKKSKKNLSKKGKIDMSIF